MEVGTLLALVGLALVDSTSLGTLLLPVWMMLDPAMRVTRFLTYLGTVTGFYFVVGILLVLGAEAAQRTWARAAEGDALSWTQLVVGVGLFALSFYFEPKLQARRRLRSGRPDAATRWRAKLSGASASNLAMVALGLGAAGLEVMTMLPYLAAIGLLTTAGVGARLWLPLLLGYVLVMVAPAALLLVARAVAARRAQAVLQWLNAWMSRHSAGALSWVLGIIGFVLAADAATRLALF